MCGDKTMCGDKRQAKDNREHIANDYGGSWHREQQSITESWQFGEVKPQSLKTYDLPSVVGITKIKPRLDDD